MLCSCDRPLFSRAPCPTWRDSRPCRLVRARLGPLTAVLFSPCVRARPRPSLAQRACSRIHAARDFSKAPHARESPSCPSWRLPDLPHACALGPPASLHAPSLSLPLSLPPASSSLPALGGPPTRPTALGTDSPPRCQSRVLVPGIRTPSHPGRGVFMEPRAATDRACAGIRRVQKGTNGGSVQAIACGTAI